jgi:hypothetical protein
LQETRAIANGYQCAGKLCLTDDPCYCPESDRQKHNDPLYGLIFARNICVRLRFWAYDFALLGLSRCATGTGQMSEMFASEMFLSEMLASQVLGALRKKLWGFELLS